MAIYFEAKGTRGNEAGPPSSGLAPWVPPGHDDTRRLTIGNWTLETGDPRLARLDTLDGGPPTRIIDRMRAPPCWYHRTGTLASAFARSLACLAPEEHLLLHSAVRPSIQVSTLPPSARPIPTDPVLPRRAPRQVNQTKSALVMVWS